MQICINVVFEAKTVNHLDVQHWGQHGQPRNTHADWAALKNDPFEEFMTTQEDARVTIEVKTRIANMHFYKSQRI